jgi:hypothetical protein
MQSAPNIRATGVAELADESRVAGAGCRPSFKITHNIELRRLAHSALQTPRCLEEQKAIIHLALDDDARELSHRFGRTGLMLVLPVCWPAWLHIYVLSRGRGAAGTACCASRPARCYKTTTNLEYIRSSRLL